MPSFSLQKYRIFEKVYLPLSPLELTYYGTQESASTY